MVVVMMMGSSMSSAAPWTPGLLLLLPLLGRAVVGGGIGEWMVALFHAGDEVPEWCRLVDISNVRHDCDD